MYARFIIWFSSTVVGSWVVKHIASPLDPLIFKATNGRFTSTGPLIMPMLAMTATGRRSGKPQSVQLVYVEHEGDYLVVASSMGQQKHPAWRYNIEANAEVRIQMRGERFTARARVLTDAEKEKVWPGILRAIPQMKVYEKRTDRNIRVFRLTRATP